MWSTKKLSTVFFYGLNRRCVADRATKKTESVEGGAEFFVTDKFLGMLTIRAIESCNTKQLTFVFPARETDQLTMLFLLRTIASK
jgi:hypothetical protein